jgi:hypothetical protein
MLVGTIYFDVQLASNTLSKADRLAFNWIRTNTPSESRFIIMTGENQIFCDSAQEWFPALTDRVSITTIQGNEWLPDKKFARSFIIQSGIQSCMEGSSPLDCIARYQLQFKYIYINKQGTLKNSCRVISPISRGDDLINALQEDNHYQLVYKTNAVSIFSILR